MAARGDSVSVLYRARILDGGAIDRRADEDEPLTFRLGAGQVLAGLDEGVVGMRVGGTRRLILPPELGYGGGGDPPVIPPDAELVYEIELVEVSSEE